MGLIRKKRRERRSIKRRSTDLLERLRASESLTLWVEAVIVIVAIFLAFQWMKVVRGTATVARGVAEISSTISAPAEASGDVKRTPANQSKNSGKGQ